MALFKESTDGVIKEKPLEMQYTGDDDPDDNFEVKLIMRARHSWEFVMFCSLCLLFN